MGSSKPLRILAIEPYFGGSHKYFLEGLKGHSRHNLEILALPARYWKWRMHGGALTLALQATELDGSFDLVFASEMLNLPNFLAMTRRRLARTPVVLYFHENQATYPMPPFEKRDLTYAYINWASLVAADEAWFNSEYHLEEFFNELPRLLKHFPDYQNLESIGRSRAKSSVMEPGCALAGFDKYRKDKSKTPRVIWNHRWEYDKNPDAFFKAMKKIRQRGVEFELVLAGQNSRKEPGEFLEGRRDFSSELVHFGFVPEFSGYADLLWSSHFQVSTAKHEFFGMACLEAMYCGCHPLLPNRLNYPNLVPEEFLYEDNEELVENLAALLAAAKSARGGKARRLAARYDWSKRAPEFDDAFERVVESRGR